MLKNNLGYPRIGNNRELKKACESFWSSKITSTELQVVAQQIRKQNWILQKESGIDLIPSNDFSFYDQVLDTILLTGSIPDRFDELSKSGSNLDLYFAMARGLQNNDHDLKAMEMTKWFDTNYHYIVPEFIENQKFTPLSTKIIDEFREAKELGIITKPVLLGPVSFLLLGKEKEEGFHRLDLLPDILPIYAELILKLEQEGAEWIQLDEPCLVLDLDAREKQAFLQAYTLPLAFSKIKILLSTYFGHINDKEWILNLHFDGLHLDLTRSPENWSTLIPKFPKDKLLSLGLIDGRNIWKNDYAKSLALISKATEFIDSNHLAIASSCSLLHSPCDLDSETDEQTLPWEIKKWFSFAKQKLQEINDLYLIVTEKNLTLASRNEDVILSRKNSSLIHKENIKRKVSSIQDHDAERFSTFAIRKKKQQKALKLPLFPTTTIGSFPQTTEVRKYRSLYRKGEITLAEYENQIKVLTLEAIRIQEEIGLDVFVHGEFERNDMVEYFGEELEGFCFSSKGWVQSYGSRCVKPPIIYGDVQRKEPMTVKWSTFAQANTKKHMKGMLTGPITILQWSFVRDDQERSITANQIALAIREEVQDLERAGINIIQIDEPAIREGLPLRKSEQKKYLDWAVFAFRLSASGVKDETQIHTHMCYSEFNDIIKSISEMDADVITIETSRSQMELLDAFEHFAYPNEIGPGVYDIHSPRVPTVSEMEDLLEKALTRIPQENLWVNPDCGLKTRHWDETILALKNMVLAAQNIREKINSKIEV